MIVLINGSLEQLIIIFQGKYIAIIFAIKESSWKMEIRKWKCFRWLDIFQLNPEVIGIPRQGTAVLLCHLLQIKGKKGIFAFLSQSAGY